MNAVVLVRYKSGMRSEGEACEPGLWRALAEALVQEVPQAVLVLDGETRLRLLNRSMEQVSGWIRDQVLGKPLAELCVDSDAQNLQATLRRCLSGQARRFDCLVEQGTVPPLRLRIGLQSSRIVIGSRAWIVARVVTTERLRGADEEPRDLSYEVEPDGDGWRVVRAMSFDGRPRLPRGEGGLCHRVLHGRSEPCEDCPLLQEGARWPRLSVRVPPGGAGVDVLRAYRLDSGRVRVQVTSLASHALASIVRARVASLARDAGLSHREHAVAVELAVGRSLEEVARHLGISSRTVRFHQRNAMSKLGVSSRQDLARLVFGSGAPGSGLG